MFRMLCITCMFWIFWDMDFWVMVLTITLFMTLLVTKMNENFFSDSMTLVQYLSEIISHQNRLECQNSRWRSLFWHKSAALLSKWCSSASQSEDRGAENQDKDQFHNYGHRIKIILSGHSLYILHYLVLISYIISSNQRHKLSNKQNIQQDVTPNISFKVTFVNYVKINT